MRHSLLSFVIVAVSGNPAALILGKDGTYVAALLILAILWLRRPIPIERSSLIFALVICGLTIVHVANFGTLVIFADLGFLTKICIGLLAVTIIPDFLRRYVRLLAILSCVSLLFYIPQSLGFDVAGALSFLDVPILSGDAISSIRHIGIHNFHQDYETRNSGMFWEPGAFAGYIVLALFLAVAIKNWEAISLWEILALVAGLLSTQSTAGYLAGMLVGVYYLIDRNFRGRYLSLLPLLPVLLSAFGAVSYLIFTEVDFLGDKVEEQLLFTRVARTGNEINRFGNMLYDIDSISQRPLTGWSGNPETRIALDPELAEFIAGQGAALTGLWVRFGGIGWLAFFLALYVSANRLVRDPFVSMLFLVIFAVLLVGEQFTNFPLIYAFMALTRQYKDAKSGMEVFKTKSDRDIKWRKS